MIKVRNCTAEDLDRICEIENESFTDPWSRQSFAHTIKDPLVKFVAAEISSVESSDGKYPIDFSPTPRRNNCGICHNKVIP